VPESVENRVPDLDLKTFHKRLVNVVFCNDHLMAGFSVLSWLQKPTDQDFVSQTVQYKIGDTRYRV